MRRYGVSSTRMPPSRWPSVGDPTLRPKWSADGPRLPARAVGGCLGAGPGNAPGDTVSEATSSERARGAGRTVHPARARARARGQVSAGGVAAVAGNLAQTRDLR